MTYPKTVESTGNVRVRNQSSPVVQEVTHSQPQPSPVYQTRNAWNPVETRVPSAIKDRPYTDLRPTKNLLKVTGGFKGHVRPERLMTRSLVAVQ